MDLGSTPAECKYTLCNMDGPCFGLHDPFVCRVIPAALRFVSKLKEEQLSDHLLPPGLIDALLTQTLKYGDTFDGIGMFDDYCEFIVHNYLEFFRSVYRDELPDFSAFINYIRLVVPFEQFMKLINAQLW